MPLTEETFQVTVLTAVILAALARTLIPYIAKRQDDTATGEKPRPFSLGYIVTAVISSIPVLVGSLLLFPAILPQIANTGTGLIIFITAFGLSYTVNDVVNRSVSITLPSAVSTKPSEPTPATVK